MLHSRTSRLIHCTCNPLHLLTPDSEAVLPPPPPLGNRKQGLSFIYSFTVFPEHPGALSTVLGAENTAQAKQTGPLALEASFIPISEPYPCTWHLQMPNQCLGRRIRPRMWDVAIPSCWAFLVLHGQWLSKSCGPVERQAHQTPPQAGCTAGGTPCPGRTAGTPVLQKAKEAGRVGRCVFVPWE